MQHYPGKGEPEHPPQGQKSKSCSEIVKTCTLERYPHQIAGLRARSISSKDLPFVSTTLPAMYRTARIQTVANPKYTELIPNLVTTLRKQRPMMKLEI